MLVDDEPAFGRLSYVMLSTNALYLESQFDTVASLKALLISSAYERPSQAVGTNRQLGLAFTGCPGVMLLLALEDCLAAHPCNTQLALPLGDQTLPYCLDCPSPITVLYCT